MTTTSDIERRGRLPRPKPAPPFRHSYVDANVRLHVVELGPADGPPVVLLHGFPEFWYGWHHVMPVLAAAGYRVLAPDMRGYNKSDKPAKVEDYNLEVLADDIASLLDGLSLEQVKLVGHDWGGAVAWMTAARHPKRITRLVILNMPHPVVFAAAWKTLKQRFRSAYFYFFRARTFASFVYRAFNAAGQRLMLWWFSGRALGSAELEKYAEAGLQPGAMKSSMSYYTALLARDPDAPIAGMATIECPVRVLWGSKDPAFGRAMANPGKWAPHHEVVYLDDLGHFLHLEDPARVSLLLRDVLED